MKKLYVVALWSVAAGLLTGLAGAPLTGCVRDGYYPDNGYYGGGEYDHRRDAYYMDQYGGYELERERRLEMERAAVAADRQRLERERLAWENQQRERLEGEKAARARVWQEQRQARAQDRMQQERHDRQRQDRDRQERARQDQARQDQARREQIQREQTRREHIQREQRAGGQRRFQPGDGPRSRRGEQ